MAIVPSKVGTIPATIMDPLGIVKSTARSTTIVNPDSSTTSVNPSSFVANMNPVSVVAPTSAASINPVEADPTHSND